MIRCFPLLFAVLCVSMYIHTHTLWCIHTTIYTERASSSFPLCFPSMCNIYTLSLFLWDDCWFWGNSNHQLLSPHIMIYNLCIEIVHYRKSKRQVSLSLLNSYVLICHHHTTVMMEVRNICCLDISAPQKQGGQKTERSLSACRYCCYTVDCATTRAHWSIFLWKKLQFSVSFVKRALVMAEGLMISFDRGMASLYFIPVFIPLPLILLSIFTP